MPCLTSPNAEGGGVSKTPNALFLETTIHALRVVGSRAEKDAYRAQHAGCDLRSSAYVLGAFKKTFLRDAVRFHTLLADSADPWEALGKLNRTFSNRTYRRSVLLFTVLAREAQEKCRKISRKSLLDRLEMLIEWQLEGRFRFGLSEPLVNETECKRADVSLSKTGGLYDTSRLRCWQAASSRCGLREFLGGKRAKLVDTERALASTTDPELQRLLGAVRTVLNGGNPAGRVCESLADAIIAVECPAELVLQTTNERHYRPLCQALGKALAIWKWPPG
jgi:hypothetical protein